MYYRTSILYSVVIRENNDKQQKSKYIKGKGDSNYWTDLDWLKFDTH